MPSRTPRGGRGSNQYQTRGSPMLQPARDLNGDAIRLSMETILAGINEEEADLKDLLERDAPLASDDSRWAKAVFSQDTYLCQAASRREDCPPELLSVLASTEHPSDPYGVARHQALMNPSCPVESLVSVLDHDLDVKNVAAALTNRHCPPGVVVARIQRGELTTRDDLNVAVEVARHYRPEQTDVHEANIAWLETWDTARHVADVYLANSNTTPEVLEALDGRLMAIQGWEHHLTSRFGDHHNCPTFTLARLADSDDNLMAGKAALHGRTPPEVLDALSLHHDETTRKIVARNPSTPEAAMVRLADDTAEVQMALVNRWDCPPAALDVLSRSPYRAVRQKVVAHHNTPDQTRVAVIFAE